MVFSNIISINVSVSVWYTQVFQIIFPCKAMASSNIIPINVNFVKLQETGSSSAKIIKIFLGQESLKHLSSPWNISHLSGYPSTTKSPSSKNYSMCNYEPLSLSNMKRHCSIYLFSFLRIISLLCSIDSLIKDSVFTKWKYNSLA